MKPPILVIAPPRAGARLLDALGADFAITIVSDTEQARAHVATGFHCAAVAFGDSMDRVEGVAQLPADAETHVVLAQVRDLLVTQRRDEQLDPRTTSLASLPYAEYIELARSAASRRYLIGLLARHHGSVTDAARAAGLKRESLHRLLRRHQLDADDFRER